MESLDSSGARQLAEFIDASPSPFHAVAEAGHLLDEAGFTAVEPTGSWPDGPGRWYLARGGSLVAWAVPESAASVASSPFRLVGAHTDSPNLRVKPQPDTGRAGWRQLGVEVYGGALLNSWLDRDLGLSGRVAVRPAGGTDPVELRLLLVQEPVARVPQLAIHLDRGVNEGLALNRQAHLAPVWSLGAPEPGRFRRFLAGRLDTKPDSIQAWDLMFHDLTPSTLLGPEQELLAAPRIDNLASCHSAVRALAGLGATGPDVKGSVAAVALFDHEEVGSTSATGAAGSMLAHVLERTVLARGGSRDDFLRALAGSVCVSADGAHATHPNYADRHEPDHFVQVNAGPVLKTNANQRYATDAATAAVFESACAVAGVGCQRFVSRTDLPCGSTIGPVTAAWLGMPTVDAGIGELSMHSARELCGAGDPGYFTSALGAFLAVS